MKNHNKYQNFVDEIVEAIIAELPLISRVRAANISRDDFRVIELLVVNYIRNRLDQVDAAVNKELMRDCLEKSADSLDEIDPAFVILGELRLRLRETNKLWFVKWG